MTRFTTQGNSRSHEVGTGYQRRSRYDVPLHRAAKPNWLLRAAIALAFIALLISTNPEILG